MSSSYNIVSRTEDGQINLNVDELERLALSVSIVAQNLNIPQWKLDGTGQQRIEANLDAPHSPEPWFHTKGIYEGVVADYDYDGPSVEMHSEAMPRVSYHMGALTPANARRACACVNFMEGTLTEAIEAWVKSGVRFTQKEGE